MQNAYSNKLNDLRFDQIIDANLDRAREGLRVLEDWARFGLGREDFVKQIKNYRQLLGKHHLYIYKKSRNYTNDKCTGLSHPEQFNRSTFNEIISTNAARIQEALRVIEEFAKNKNKELSALASKIRYEIYLLELDLLDSTSNKELKEILFKTNLYSITHENKLLIKKIEEILEGGVKMIQHRFKNGNDLDNLKKAKIIKELCHQNDALFIVNDRADIALAVDADGVHLGQKDLCISSARKILGYSKLIGISANNESDIKKAIKDGCDYLGVGPVYASNTKQNKIPLGLKEIQRITKDISIPWFAIGGIKYENLADLKSNGVNKVAIVSELMDAENPKEKAIMILKELSNEN